MMASKFWICLQTRSFELIAIMSSLLFCSLPFRFKQTVMNSNEFNVEGLNICVEE